MNSFSKSFDELDERIRSKRDEILSRGAERQSASLGGFQPQVTERLRQLNKSQVMQRNWEKTDSLETKRSRSPTDYPEPPRLARRCFHMKDRVPEMKQLAEEVREAGYTSVVLLGMGGSSLARRSYTAYLESKKATHASSCWN